MDILCELIMSKPIVAKNAAAITLLRGEMGELKRNFEKSMEQLQIKLDEMLLREKEDLLPTDSTENVIEERNILIIGDSIISSIDPEMIDPDADITVECIWGLVQWTYPKSFTNYLKLKDSSVLLSA